MKLLQRLLPQSLVVRVFSLYCISLLVFVGVGMGMFFRHEFTQHVDDALQSAQMLSEVASHSVTDSAVIGDYDTIKRTLDKVVNQSQFARAAFIDMSGAVVQSEHPVVEQARAPDWLRQALEAHLEPVNHNIAVGGKDYGVLRLILDANSIAAGLWALVRAALLLALASLLGGWC